MGLGSLLDLRHGHNLDDQAGPAGKVLSALTGAGLGIILLPGEAGLLPAFVDGLDEVLPELVVHLLCLLLVRARARGNGLRITSAGNFVRLESREILTKSSFTIK